jgi:endoglucanase
VESHDIGWSWWPLKKMGDNNPLGIRVEPSWQRLVDYWTAKGPRPSEQEAEQALQALLQDIRLENNIVHREVIDALFLP